MCDVHGIGGTEIPCLGQPISFDHDAMHRASGQATGYIGIQSFGQNTSRDVEAGLSAVLQSGVGDLILDLRGNAGGMVSAGVP